MSTAGTQASDDIDIEAHDNEIQITGEIVEKERAGILRRRTRRVGRFEYRVTLPGPIDRGRKRPTHLRWAWPDPQRLKHSRD
jgi:HSP20 family molecular chaperone IbpA